MKKFLKTSLIVVLCLAILVGLVVGGFNLYLRISLSEFYKNAKKEGVVPGIKDGYVHQGLSYAQEDEQFISCGYMVDDSASRIYLFDGKNEKYVKLYKNGEENTCHAGGLAYHDGLIYMADGDNISIYKYRDIKNAKSGDKVQMAYSFEVGFDVAFCHVEDGILYLGEFYREENYTTDKSHHFTTPAGDSHHAIVVAYSLALIKLSGYQTAIPLYAYSVVDLAQGMCFTDSGNLCIATSYGLANSHIYVYSLQDLMPSEMISVNGIPISLTFLDGNALVKDFKLIPMCEEIISVNGRVFLLNESASNKYIFGKLTGGKNFYSIKLD